SSYIRTRQPRSAKYGVGASMRIFSRGSVKIDPVPDDIDRFALGLVVGPGIQLAQQTQDDELYPHEEQEGGQDQERIAVHAEMLEHLHIDGHAAASQAGQEGVDPPLAKELDRLGGIAQQEFHRHQVKDYPQGSGYAVF